MAQWARAVSSAILNTTAVGPAAKRLSHKVAGAPRNSPLRLLAPIRSALKGEATAARVLQVLSALEDAGVPCWLAGGWGIDALLGRQTRRHDDVDVVLEAFHAQSQQACEALSRIGFRVTGRYQHPTWMPDQWTLEDDGACRIDLLSIDWHLLESAVAGLSESGESELAGRAVTEGTVGGRRVRCLSAFVQRIFHSGFESRHVDTHDLANLAMGPPAAG